MTIQTLGRPTDPYRNHPAYYAGRADAYDDSTTRTLDQMTALASMAIDYADLPYAFGYSDRVNELHLEHDAVTPMEIELAHAVQARQQGHGTSPLHTRRPNHNQGSAA